MAREKHKTPPMRQDQPVCEMTILEHLCCAAMQGLLANGNVPFHASPPSTAATALAQARALLNELSKLDNGEQS